MFKVYATGQKIRKDGTKAISRKRWIASFLFEHDVYSYVERVQTANPTWIITWKEHNV